MSTKDAGADGEGVADERYALKYGFSLDLAYIKSVHGILTAAITILSFIAFICVAGGGVYCGSYGPNDFFGFVSMSAFLTGLFNYILYIFTFYDKIIFKFVPWHIVDLIWCGVWTFFYLVASSVVAARTCGNGGNAAGAVFGFVVMVIMGAKAYFAFRKLQEIRAEKAGTGSQSHGSSPEYSAEGTKEQY